MSTESDTCTDEHTTHSASAYPAYAASMESGTCTDEYSTHPVGGYPPYPTSPNPIQPKDSSTISTESTLASRAHTSRDASHCVTRTQEPSSTAKATHASQGTSISGSITSSKLQSTSQAIRPYKSQRTTQATR